MTIFVSIASYRDPELVPTIQDCLAKARCPEQLHFGICWQHGEDESTLSPYSGDPRFQILDVAWRGSKGVCWARSEIMRLWQGEEHFLQIDSHHRFVQDWDAKLIGYAEIAASSKPVITTYCPMYLPADDDLRPEEPTQIDFDYFTEDSVALLKPSFIPAWPTLTRPLRARFVSGHFLFAPGSFVEEVPYNPDLYFHGEEITLALRAFTWGYDFFHPPEVILWHEYSRSYRRKHWDDHVEPAQVEMAWHQRDVRSKDEVRRLLTAPRDGPFCCGSVRTLEQYEAYAGISFSHRIVQDYTREGHEPPNPPAAADWAEDVRVWNVEIELARSELPIAAWTDPDFWYIGIHDANGEELYRHDLAGDELTGVVDAASDRVLIRREFQSGRPPTSWTVWPVTATLGWLDRVTRPVQCTDASWPISH